MDSYYTYILYSKALDKFYIGATRLTPEERKTRHLRKYYGDSKFTAKSSDWVLFHEIECSSFTQALKIEKHIKSMKSKTYIKNLVLYQETTEKLLKRYSEKEN